MIGIICVILTAFTLQLLTKRVQKRCKFVNQHINFTATKTYFEVTRHQKLVGKSGLRVGHVSETLQVLSGDIRQLFFIYCSPNHSRVLVSISCQGWPNGFKYFKSSNVSAKHAVFKENRFKHRQYSCIFNLATQRSNSHLFIDADART